MFMVMKGMMLAAALMFAAISGTSAGTLTDRNGRAWSYVDPPAKWSKAPYSGTTRVFYLPESEVNDICRSYGVTNTTDKFFGCSVPSPAICLVYITKDESDHVRQIILRHETAHCAGWPANHPLTGPERADSLPN